MELEIYGNDGIDDESLIMSEKVQSVATRIYREFERIIPTYGEEVIKDMMPHIVGLLENLNIAYKEIQEKDAELELSKDDNEQLMNQYEREKQLRKATDQRMMALEDILEEERKEKDSKLDALQLAVRAGELKIKSIVDQANRLEDKDLEMKKDYGKLHDRYNELLKRHMECVEKSKHSDEFSMTTSLHRNFHLPNLKRFNPMSEDTPLMTRSLADYEAQFVIQSPYSSRMNLGEEAVTPTEDNCNDLLQNLETETKRRLIIPDSNTIIENHATHDDDDDDIGRLINPSEFSSERMSEEIENLIMENTELMAMKNALNILKDDLIIKVDTLNSDIEIVKEELATSKLSGEKLKGRLSEMETELKDCRSRLEVEKRTIAGEDDNGLSMAQRKRFTRVEMARVLMERNQYKERLMELQEAVRWTELLRASREHPDLLPGSGASSKKKSSIWNYFERLFSRRLEPQRRSLALAAVHYNAPTSPRKERLRSSSAQRSYNIDKKSPKIVRRDRCKNKISSGSGGWSLVPGSACGVVSRHHQPDIIQPLTSSRMDVPVPIYCKPLYNEARALKISCATVVETNSVWLSSIGERSESAKFSLVHVLRPGRLGDEMDSFEVEDEAILCMQYISCSLDSDSTFVSNDCIKVVEDSDSNLENSIKVTACKTLFTVASSVDENKDTDTVSSEINLSRATVWMGTHSGRLLIFEAVDAKSIICSVQLEDTVMAISETPNRIFVALANSTISVFCRKEDGGHQWNLKEHYEIVLSVPSCAIRCVVSTSPHEIWFSQQNMIWVLNSDNLTLSDKFEGHPRSESQIRQMAALGSRVWVSTRLDSTLRLFDSTSRSHIQDVDLEPYISKMLGTGKLGFSFVRITCLSIFKRRIWIGTANGVIVCVPLQECEGSSQSIMSRQSINQSTEQSNNKSNVAFLSMAQTQLSFHGLKESVKFFVSCQDKDCNNFDLDYVICGGEGYVDFRHTPLSADGNETETRKDESDGSKNSHVIIWSI